MQETAVHDASGSGKNEEWFLAELEKPEIPFDALFGFLGDLQKAGRVSEALALAEFLQDAMAERGAVDKAVRVLAMRVVWKGLEAGSARGWNDTAVDLLEKARSTRSFAEHAGFTQDLPAADAVRRLIKLIGLQPGVFCHNKTWGFGVVSRVDAFYGRVVVDFERKPQHPMALSYAAEALELIDDAHLLAVKHRRPEELKAMIENDPAGVVVKTLRSYGPLSVAQLQQTLVPAIMPDSQWKPFWESARKQLKNNPQVDIPVKRSDPIRLSDREKRYDEGWFAALAQERDLLSVLQRIGDLSEAEKIADLPETHRRIIADRLAFVLKGANRKQSGLYARAVVAIKQSGVSPDGFDFAKRAENFFHPEQLLATAHDMPIRDVRAFYRFLFEHDPDRSAALLLGALKDLEISPLNEAMDILIEHGKEKECADLLRGALVSQKAEVEFLCWIARNLDRVSAWSLCSLPDLAFQILIEIDKNHSGERLRAKNLIKERFEQSDWVKAVMEPMTDVQRRDFMERVRESAAWAVVDRQSVMGRMIKLFPELQEVLAEKISRKTPIERGPVTSFRSYRERQAQLEKIVSVEIPKISKEIGVARGYGDLRENFEFKAAKEMQALLLRRQAELEAMLHNVKPTDFTDATGDRVGPGTGVTLRYPDGKEERYFILGEWDRDEKLGIISSTTQMAKALEGHRAGEEVTVPTENGSVACRLETVTGLSDEVRAWVNG